MARDLAALSAYLADRAGMPFAWGRKGNDCVSFAAGAVQAQTGRDVLCGLDWRSEKGARRRVAVMGGLESAVTSRMGAPIAPARAHRGDVAGVMVDGGMALMIVEGATLVGPENRRLPRGAMIRAWSAEGVTE